MALAAGLHGAVRLNFSRPGKIEQFGVNFKARIIVDSDVIRPFKRISGKIDIETRFPIKHKELLIQFEGMCILRYTTKFDNRTTFHQGRNCLVSNTKCLLLEKGGFQKSPVSQIILHESSNAGYVINPGSATYPFQLEIPADNLPAPFKNSLGSLVYRLVVYMKSHNDCFVEVAEKSMRFNGHYNLLNNVAAVTPVTVENFYRKSTFSRKKVVETVFTVDIPGCLPGENIPFVFYAKNPKCMELQVSIELVQQLKFDASGRRDSVKKKFAILAKKERDDFECQPELTWIDVMEVPETAEPTFSTHIMYNVTYCLQYKVKIPSYGTMKGEAPVYIGTTRDPVQVLRHNANGLDVPFIGLRRRGSASSTHSVGSHNSATTTYSLPPAYSQLASRIPSVETLPPNYDEIDFMENTHGEIMLEVPARGEEAENAIVEEEESDSN